jgi:iron complex outermembrane recepter protein
VYSVKHRIPIVQTNGAGPRKYGIIIALALGSTLASHNVLAAEKISFNLPDGPASETLSEFGAQAGLSVLYDYTLQTQTHAVHGLYDQKKALAIMLSGTDLTFDLLSNGRVSVRPVVWPPPNLDRRPLPANQKIMDVVTVSTGTGTHISGSQPVGSQLKILGQAEIQASGVNTAADLARRLTQNFNGGPSEDTHLIGEETKSNSGFGQGVNLRGLGSRATLVLINGRRVAPSGSEASFVDISNIPLSAVDHVEILLDGASAVYGSDAVGGVVNLITKDNCTKDNYTKNNCTKESYQGAETFGNVGNVTEGSQLQYRTYQLLGTAWDTGSAFASFEWYHRDALSAADRPYTTSNLIRFGGPNFDSLASNPGTISVGGVNYAIPSGQNGIGLNFLSLVPGTANLSDLYRNAQVLPSQTERSLYAAIHQAFNDNATVFGTALWTDRNASEAQSDQRITEEVPSSNPFLLNRPVGTVPLLVAYDLADDFGVVTNEVDVRTINLTLGVDFVLAHQWHVSTSMGEVVENEHQRTLGEADPVAVDTALQTTFNPFGDGSNMVPATLAPLRLEPWFNSKSELRDFNSSADGPVYGLPGGELRGAFGVELRYQRFATELSPPAISDNLIRQLMAGFAEVVAPLFGPANARAGLQMLEVSLAARLEHYSDFGRTITPRVGVAWTPVSGVKLSSSWGKSTRAPNPGDLDERSNVAFLQSLPDSSSASGSSKVLVVSGKNAHLSAERATSGTFGVSFAPEFIPGFHADADYFHIVFTDRIQSTDYDTDILNDPYVQYIVTRNPSATLRAQICDDANNHFGGTVTECLQASIDAIVDLRDRNLATLRTQGIDFDTQYSFDTSSLGRLTLDLASTYLLEYSQMAMPNTASVSLLNTLNNPINLKLIGGCKWEWRGAWALVAMNYVNSYRDTTSVPERNIGSWLTFDLQVGYRWGDGAGRVLKNAEIAVNAVNAFDRAPPFAIDRSASLGYDEENADPTGRVVTLSVRKRW